MTDPCANCGGSEADPYVFCVHGESPTEAYLCEECFSSLEREFDRTA